MANPCTLEKVPSGDYALLSLHRQENTDDRERLAAWVNALNVLAQGQKIIMPMHPRTQAKLEAYGLALEVEIIAPQNHRNLLELIKHSAYVLSDSGGMQKEAFYLGKYCFTLRAETEWTELVDLGVNYLVEPDTLIPTIEKCDFGVWPEGMPYGEGNCGEKIVQILRF
jgi:UDP-GlcNAc3NAcA epimerase